MKDEGIRRIPFFLFLFCHLIILFTFAQVTAYVMDKESQHICNLRKGDTTSFEYLYTVWSGKLYNFVMRISKGIVIWRRKLYKLYLSRFGKGRSLLIPENRLELTFVQLPKTNS